jgi:8-oxo-dGTP pyrophosphatase MutT (NUDIX family)
VTADEPVDSEKAARRDIGAASHLALASARCGYLPMQMSESESSYEVLSSRSPYTGARVAVRVDTLAMPDGSIAEREVAVVDDAVAVVALDERRRVCLLRQYRHPFGERVLELPAGKIDVVGESPLQTARRELEEEARLRSEQWSPLTCFLNSAGWTTERTHLFLAEGVYAGGAEQFLATGEEADLELAMVPLDECLTLIDGGEIVDAKTIAGLLLATRRLA